MKKVPSVIAIALFYLVVSVSGMAAYAEEYTYVDLVNRLTDLEYPATLPAVGEQCQQWSSYDRRSKYDDSTGKYVGWFANGDGDGIIRKEGETSVFAEMKGPGVIWRIWSALANEGHVKIYLDGATEPAVDLPFIGYFNRRNEPFTRPALVHQTARGQNCYVPIPFQKSCKITGEGDWGRYFHFTYTTYPEGTILPTFKRKLTSAESKALDKANEVLTSCSVDPAKRPQGALTFQNSVKAEPGATVEVANLKGARAITAIKVSTNSSVSADDYDALRELVLSIQWDGESKPSVWAPLGDFFGTAPGVNEYKSLPLGMSEEGFYSQWYMPFKDGAVVSLTNDGEKQRRITFEITHAPITKPIDSLGRFHAKWHRDAMLPQEPERAATECIDWTMLKTEGRGRFCGVMLHVWNPRGGWWGEGDEKFFVDGEKFPSTIGTGSEDYFGYAWCDPSLFTNCYHNQTISIGNRGHVSVNRWHITDNIPFQKSFEGAIEKYYPNSKPTLYAATSYWYQAAGQADPYEPVPLDQRKGYWTELEIFKVKGAIEGESMKVLAKSGGSPARQDLFNFGVNWSSDAHLWWINSKPGDTLDLALPVKKAGSYRLKMQLTKAVDYGIVQLYLDGKKLGEPIDLFNNGVVPTGVLDMGVHQLSQAQHMLRVEIVGANEKAKKQYMFGLDYILLEEVKTSFYVPENPDYTIFDSVADSVRFTLDRTLIKYNGNLACKSSFVDQNGEIMGWHDFGNLEGPGWAANAVGGAYEIYLFGKRGRDPTIMDKAVKLLDHVLLDGFIDYDSGFITPYRDTSTNKFCLNYQHKDNWLCPGSMAKIAYQLLIFSDHLDDTRKQKMRAVALKTADWMHNTLGLAPNGWYPRRCKRSGEPYPLNAYGDSDILYANSADGLFIVQLMTELTQRGLADYAGTIREKVAVFMQAGGIFGSINHDTYDRHENVAYSVAFRVLRQAAKLLGDEAISKFAYEKCLAGLDRFKMTEDRNGVATKGLLYMEDSWDTSYLWENAEAALAYLEAYKDTMNKAYLSDALTILRAAAKHHHGQYGFLTEGVDWNNHVGKQHHFDEVEFGDIKYTEPLLNNLHIVEPTLLALHLQENVSATIQLTGGKK